MQRSKFIILIFETKKMKFRRPSLKKTSLYTRNMLSAPREKALPTNRSIDQGTNGLTDGQSDIPPIESWLTTKNPDIKTKNLSFLDAS